jgi:hypothetical protein
LKDAAMTNTWTRETHSRWTSPAGAVNHVPGRGWTPDISTRTMLRFDSWLAFAGGTLAEAKSEVERISAAMECNAPAEVG